MTTTEIINKISLEFESKNPDKFYAIDLKQLKIVCDGKTYQSCRKKAARLIPDCHFTIRKELPSVMLFL